MMRHIFSLPVLTFTASILAVQAAAQESPPASQARVYYDEAGVTAPILSTSLPENFYGGAFKKGIYGLAVFSAVVDVNGVPHNIQLTRPSGKGIDTLASKVVEGDRFTPGTRNGSSVPVAVLIEVGVFAYKESEKDTTGQKIETFHLKSLPTQTVELEPPSPEPTSDRNRRKTITLPDGSSLDLDGVRVMPPRVLHSVEAKYSDPARLARIQGVCLVSLIVDDQGMPQELHLIRSNIPSLDQNAIQAILQYRFQPAMKDGAPITVTITIEVDFRLF